MSQKRAPRHRSREVALQTLYALDVGRGARSANSTDATEETDETDETEGKKAADVKNLAPSAEEAFEGIAENFDLPEGARSFAQELAFGTAKYLSPIDELVETHAKNWRVSRMAAVDRNILRLAIYELLYTETPVSVVLDEAIELAHHFGSDSSPPFVNGVLDAVARATADRRSEESPA